jgi:polyisoprenoid-binding protein YceI
MTLRHLLVAACAALALAAAPRVASAADYKAGPGSTLGFSSSFEGEAFSGRFARFTPTIRFDPAKLAASRFDVAIDLASVDTQSDERDETLRSIDFFNVRKLAQARYVATTFRALGKGRFVADGMLSLNGVSRPVALTFSWTPGAKPVLNGTATLKRLEFGIGTGDWADTGALPDAVSVSTRLLLVPVATGR